MVVAIVTDSVTSFRSLKEFIENHLGGKHYRYEKRLQEMLSDKGIELNNNGEFCPLAIETSGHAAMKETIFLMTVLIYVQRLLLKWHNLLRKTKQLI